MDVVNVPPPVAPDDPAAWYAPDVQSQYTIHPNVVVTIRDAENGFAYEVREPSLNATGQRAFERIINHFSGTTPTRPLTREGAAERLRAGFDPKYERVVTRLVNLSPAARRRVDYHALVELRCLGRLTPHALDEDLEVVDLTDQGGTMTPVPGHTAQNNRDMSEGGAMEDIRGTTNGSNPHVDGSCGPVVHTTDYAPATIDVDTPEHAECLASERVARYTVEFQDFSVPVEMYRERALGNDPFEVKYAVREPDLLPGDIDLIAECKKRVWETTVDGVVEDQASFVRERAETILSRRLTARNTRAWLGSVRYRLRNVLATYGVVMPPVDRRYASDRLEDLVYYILRDYVGHGKLTIPIRDRRLEDIEANRLGERIKVIPRGEFGRVPTNLMFDDETAFVNVVTQMAAEDGVELNASKPSAKVNLDPGDVDETIRCAVALPTISEDGPHISIRKQAADAMTPIDLVKREAISTELVALLWLFYEYGGVVIFAGPTGVGKTTLMNAHTPFVDHGDRPISIDEGSREVRLPHETGISLTTREHQQDHKRVTMADLISQANYLNPDVEIIAEINTPASFQTFGESLNTGHGILGTLHADDVEKLVNRVVEQGLPAYLLREIDLVVFPRHVEGERYVGEVIELLSEEAYRQLEDGGSKAETPGNQTKGRSTDRGIVRKDGTKVYWNRLSHRDETGTFHMAYDHPELGNPTRELGTRVFHALAHRTDSTVEAVEDEFHRRHDYVQYLVRERVSDFQDLFAFLADLRTEEEATLERIRRESGPYSGGIGVSVDGGRLCDGSGSDAHTESQDRDNDDE